MGLLSKMTLNTALFIGIISASIFAVSTQECISSHHNQYESCTTEVFEHSRGWKQFDSICNYNYTTQTKKNACWQRSLCNKVFSMLVYSQQLFAVTMKNTVLDMLQQCCGKCASCDVIAEVESHMGHANASMVNSSDIIFPVIGESSLQKQNGFYFLPAYDVPSSYYCMRKKSRNEVINEIVGSFMSMWPLLIICLLFALISGFVMWLTERRSNDDEFPRRFHVGLFDGFWWSCVAMTTVGFGDKVPKSYLGRLFAVFWILLGITMFSMVTATLTTNIIAAREPVNTDMSGVKVGVLKGREHDIALVAQHGGMVKLGSIIHTMKGMAELISLLKNNTIEGYVVDRNTYYHFLRRRNEEKYRYLKIEMNELNIMKTEKLRRTGILMCGMLFKREEDYLFFKTYFQNSQTYLQSCNDLRMNTKGTKMDIGNNLSAYKGTILEYMMNFSLGIVGALVIVGVAVEGRRYLRNKRKAEKADGLEMEHLHLKS